MGIPIYFLLTGKKYSHPYIRKSIGTGFPYLIIEMIVQAHSMRVVYKLGILGYFSHWETFWFGGIKTFWTQKTRQEKLSKFAKIFNHIKSTCIIFCAKLM